MKDIIYDLAASTHNVTIISDNHYYNYGLRKMITSLNTDVHTRAPQSLPTHSTITFRKTLVSINYCLLSKDPRKHRPPVPFSIDIPFNCRGLSINEIQAKLEKILSLSNIILADDNNINIYESVGAKRYQQLSSMENQVLLYLGQGFCTQKIATKFGCSEKTVSTHCRNAMRKMGITKKSELYHYASWVSQHTDNKRITFCL